ncbi:MAG: hypothetical protein ACOC1K_07915 [Nanoarchaeota archaeon]
MSDFFKGFWEYMSNLQWWQGAIIIAIVAIFYLIGKYWKDFVIWTSEFFIGQSIETLQYRMFWGLTNDVLHIQVKDEIRRSFKENGFCELSGNDFAQYVKNQNKILVSILRNHMINLYPPFHKKSKIRLEKILYYIEEIEHWIEDIVFEIYIEAKRIKKNDNKSMNMIDERFSEEMEEFIEKKKNSNGDCKSCFVILFGKREIAENKKAQIKTLKSQMNFVEQKLSEIHSEFLTHFSEELDK